MKLYFSKGACSLVPRIIINEIGLSCEYEAVDLASKKTHSGADYYAINPKGAVPALEVAANEVLTENAVILQYLADTNKATQLLPAVDDFKRYRVLEWLNYTTTELHKSFGPLFSNQYPQEIKEKVIKPLIITKFEQVDKHLGKVKYLMGDTFTLPDAYLFVMIFWAVKMKFPTTDWKNVTRYFDELKARPSIQKSITDEGIKLA